MDADIEKMHLQSIEEYVLDEGKIVTYRWLSKVLNVHVNISKELLSKFSSNPSHENNVYLTYLISGKLKNGTYSVLVVGQDKFEEAKLDFEFITSHHVYSVQKNKETPSANVLYMVNCEKVENEADVSKQIGVIKCASSIQRAEEELSNLRLNSLLKNVPSATAAPAKKTAPPSDKKEKEGVEEPPDNKKTEVKKSPEKKPKAAGGIAAMFAAQSSKSTGAAASSSSSKSKAKPPPKKGGGINSFFSKAPKPQSPSEDQVNNKEQTDEAMDVDISSEETNNKSDNKKEEPEVEITSTPTEKSNDKEASTSKLSGKTPKSKPKKKSKPKSSSKPAKTRKRIKVIDSDSDDDMFASEREDSPEPLGRRSPSPPPARKIIDSDDEVIPPTPQPENGTKNHRKRKVIKDKSYMDGDFVVTEKVTVYESCSESESETADGAKKPKEEESAAKSTKTTESATKVEKPTTSKDTKKPAKKTVSPMKNKQSSLMNFFKKV